MTLVVPAGAAELPQPATAGALPTPQVNGIVFTVAIVGNTVYAGGQFSKARPAGVAPGGPGEVTRNNLLAFNLNTGALLPWAPAVTGNAYSSPTDPGPYCKNVGTQRWLCDTVFRIKASPDGKRIYASGDFTRINGQRHTKLAAFDTGTGALDSTFTPTINGRVHGLAVTSDRIFVGGTFTNVNGAARTRLASLSTTGAVQSWAPTADKEVFSLLAAPVSGRVVVGGTFDRINGASRHGMMSVDYTTGANAAWAWRPPSGDEVITDMVTDNAGTVYFGAYDSGGGRVRFEGRGALNITNGGTKWFDGCYGDTQSVAYANGIVYGGSHTHSCKAINAIPEHGPIDYQRLTAESAAVAGTAAVTSNHVHAGDPIPALLPWLPNTNGGPANSHWKNGPWALAANAQYVVVGGEFSTVNGTAQQGLTRFATRGVASAINNGPQTPFKAPTVSKAGNGNVTVRWTATWDKQNWPVHYDLMRIGASGPVYSTTAESRYWSLPRMSYVDRSAPAGKVQYWVRAVDNDGASVGSSIGSAG
ncbi:MAG: hypothetical protein ACRDQ5_11450 [Sciscionella sp.]